MVAIMSAPQCVNSMNVASMSGLVLAVIGPDGPKWLADQFYSVKDSYQQAQLHKWDHT